MYIKQLYTNCLAEAAYYIESDGEAAVIDPLRDISTYVELANERGATIKYVLETHFHADFVSGHLDLAKATGASIVYGPGAKADFEFIEAVDGQQLHIGKITLKVLHTPGHTLESCCYLLKDDKGTDYSVFTGDTLFVGDVGRPDLAVKSDLTREDLAGMLYDSLQQKLMTLEDNVIVFPGHGAGSQCGKNLSDETTSTIGTQRRNNYALMQTDKQHFVKAVTDNMLPPPQYFFKNAAINKHGYDNIDEVLSRELNPLSVDQFKNEMQNGALIIDSREYRMFSDGFISGSINIGLEGFFAVWVGTLVEDLNTPIVIVTEMDKEEETVLRLARVGYENVRGYLHGGITAWMEKREPLNKLPSICATKFKYRADNYRVVDVCNPGEIDTSFAERVINVPLAQLEHRTAEIQSDEPNYLICKTGYRSAIAASILLRKGVENIVNVKGGTFSVDIAEKGCCCTNLTSS